MLLCLVIIITYILLCKSLLLYIKHIIVNNIFSSFFYFSRATFQNRLFGLSKTITTGIQALPSPVVKFHLGISTRIMISKKQVE